MDISLSAIETGTARLLTAFIRDITERARRDGHAALARRAAGAARAPRPRRRGGAPSGSRRTSTTTRSRPSQRPGCGCSCCVASFDDPEQLDLLTDLEETIELSISRLRHLLFELRPPALDREGLAAALRLYIDESRDQSPTTFRLEDTLRSQPDEEARIILYRVAQEALTNVRKHAQAGEAEIVITERDGGFLVRITDDGVGFAPKQAQSVAGHLGLAAMRERAELAGGRIRIESAPRTGTVVECWIPSFPDRSRDADANPATQ